MSKHADLSRILDALKIGDSFTLTPRSRKEYLAMIAHVSCHGKKHKRTFTQRRASTSKNCFKFSVWRLRYSAPVRRRAKGEAAPARTWGTANVRRSVTPDGAPVLIVNEEIQ